MVVRYMNKLIRKLRPLTQMNLRERRSFRFQLQASYGKLYSSTCLISCAIKMEQSGKSRTVLLLKISLPSMYHVIYVYLSLSQCIEIWVNIQRTIRIFFEQKFGKYFRWSQALEAGRVALPPPPPSKMCCRGSLLPHPLSKEETPLMFPLKIM